MTEGNDDRPQDDDLPVLDIPVERQIGTLVWVGHDGQVTVVPFVKLASVVYEQSVFTVPVTYPTLSAAVPAETPWLTREKIMADTITVELVEAITSEPQVCSVCGRYSATGPILAEADLVAVAGIVRVCEICLEDGKIDELLELHAQRLENTAASIRSLVGRLEVPTFAEWAAQCEKTVRH